MNEEGLSHWGGLSCRKQTNDILYVRGTLCHFVFCNKPNAFRSCAAADVGEMFDINPFQSNFSANCILPSSYLFSLIPAIFLQAQPREYNAQSPVHIKTYGLPRNRKSTTCAICWPKSVLHEEKRRTGSDSGAGATKMCRTSSDIGAEQENHNVGQGPT